MTILSRLDAQTHEIVRGAALAIAMRVFGAGFNFGFNVVLARLLGAQGAGVFFLALTCMTIAAIIGRFGLDNAMLRFAAAGADTKDWEKIAGVYRQGMRIALGMSSLVAATLFILSPLISDRLFQQPELTEPLRIMALAVVPFSLLNLYAELLKSVKNPGRAVFVQGTGLGLISIALLAVLSPVIDGPRDVALIYTASCVAVLLAGIWFWRQAVPEIHARKGTFDRRQLIATSLPLFWVSIISIVMWSVDTIMLGIWTDSTAVGLYNAAARTALLVSFILVAVNTVVAPKFAALYAQGEMARLGRLARGSAALTTLIASPALLVLLVWPEFVLRMFGAEFAAASTVLVILALGQFVNVATGSVGYLLMMTGHEIAMRNIVIFSALMNIGLNALLIPRFGIIGAAAATASTLALMNFVCVGFVYRKLSIFTIANFNFSKTVK